MKNNGFTLVELLAVIVVISVIILIGTINVFGQINNSKKVSADIAMKNLEDAAVSYALSKYSIPGKSDFIANSCALTYNVDSSNLNTAIANVNCVKQVSVENLINLGYFEDTQSICNKNTMIVLYKLKTNNGSKDIYDFKSYIPNGTCKY